MTHPEEQLNLKRGGKRRRKLKMRMYLLLRQETLKKYIILCLLICLEIKET